MKTQTLGTRLGLLIVALELCLIARGQAPIITSFGRNGELVCTNLQPGTTATVEWGPTPTGPWTNTWSGLDTVLVDSNGIVRVSVPMFYRVRGILHTNLCVRPPYPSPSNMVWIPCGTFTMGNEFGAPDQSPVTKVTISQGFWMGKFEVTQSEYLGDYFNPSYFTGDLNRPVESVDWAHAMAHCLILTTSERSAGRLPLGYEYRLPTEAEWEYACRAGSTTQFNYGEDPNYTNLVDHAWYGLNSGGTTHPVGQKLPNQWGLYDMYGNVAEWCLDWYYPNLPGGCIIDPQITSVPNDPAPKRVRRGGGYNGPAGHCTSAARNYWDPELGASYIGFRVVLAPTRQ